MGSIRAAQYLRMSTEHQRYSPQHQAAAIGAYAVARGYEVVKTYRDDGISGLSIRNREGLKALLADVMNGACAFEVVLVYDVSRWGRFQNPDQSAHYEFLCAEAGVRVEYCSEPFDNDGSASSTILKAMKRVMAAEYSRELSAKVSLAQRRLAGLGFWQGAPPGYGYRRQMVNADGRPVAILEPGQYKFLASYRTRLVLGPEAEQKVVRRIFRAFVAGAGQTQIAKLLNAEGVPAAGGAPWTYMRIDHMLRSAKYVGRLETQRQTSPALRPKRHRPKSEWVVAACPAIVKPVLFEAAQARLAALKVCRRRTSFELLEELRKIHVEHGRVTVQLLEATPGAPAAGVYARRFGSFNAAKAAMDLPVSRWRRPRRRWTDPQEVLDKLAVVLEREGRLTSAIIDAASDAPHSLTVRKLFGSLPAAYARLGYVAVPKPAEGSLIAKARRASAAAQAKTSLGLGSDG